MKIAAAVITAMFGTVRSQGLLEILSPKSDIKLSMFRHSKIPEGSGYQIGQSLIGHLHFLKENADACRPFDSDFAEMIAPFERNPRDKEDDSAMVQNFVLVSQKGGCRLEQKLANLEAANVVLPIIADKGLWQVMS